MTLSLSDRGALEGFIDTVKKLSTEYYEKYKSRGANKENIIWYCKGYVYGNFIGYFVSVHQRVMDDSEFSEFIEIVERRTNEIADVLAEYPD